MRVGVRDDMVVPWGASPASGGVKTSVNRLSHVLLTLSFLQNLYFLCNRFHYTMSEPVSASAEVVNPTPPASEPNIFKVYKPSASASRPLPPLSDEDLTPTAADLKAAQNSLSARTQALVDAPLQLRAVREAEQKAKRDRWPNTTIRIRFADGTQLEKVFPSNSKIRAIYAFVRGSLREDGQQTKFVLYQPPKRDLKVSDTAVRDLSLAELNLAPASVLLLRFEDATRPDEVRKLNASGASAPLSSEVLAQAIDLPTPPSALTPVTPATSTLAEEAKNVLQNMEKKMPKWLKIGGKK
ncbi:UBX domain-containing protein [Mycena indigotica]|uniref:UBX domain-containing protein n=1 Tax=Mycena indigotica TaxID=2126181 RepID=A0A8H6W2N1_9AGAR|nr:UBX domain-containing protein [Mycena indigotica]KAF7299433.1 UBX domain-containing protein [Mycena indigotica]